MDIHGAPARNAEESGWQNAAIGDDNGEIGLESGKFGEAFRCRQSVGMAHKETEGIRQFVDGRFLQGTTAPRFTRRPALNACDFLPGLRQGGETRGRERRASHENEAH